MATLVDNSVNSIRGTISTIIFIIYPHTDGDREIGSAVSHLKLLLLGILPIMLSGLLMLSPVKAIALFFFKILIQMVTI